MLRRVCTLLLVLISAVLCLASCQIDYDHTNEDVYTFTDAAGKTVGVGKNPERIAILFSSLADIWVSAGGEVSITVGEAVERGFASQDAVLVDHGAGKAIDIEALIAAEPDFVICSSYIKAQTDAAEMLRQAGIPCAAFRVESFEDYLSVLKICTDITGNADSYIRYGEEISRKIDALFEKIPSSDTETKILFIRSGSGASSAKAKTADEHFAAAMLEELGAYNIADNAPVLLDGLSVEEILTEDPYAIFIATMGKEDAARAYMDSVIEGELWQSLSAVKSDRYYYLPKDLFQFKPNARWYDAYLYLAKLMYPEIDFDE